MLRTKDFDKCEDNIKRYVRETFLQRLILQDWLFVRFSRVHFCTNILGSFGSLADYFLAKWLFFLMKVYELRIKRLPSEIVKDFYLNTEKMITFLNNDLKDIG